MAYSTNDAMNAMFNLIETMTDMGLPVVFKGAMVLRSFTSLNSIQSRMTRDLDMSWFQKGLTNETLLQAVRTAVYRSGLQGYDVVLKRPFSDTRGAGIHIIKPGAEDSFFSLDIAVKDTPSGGESFFVQYPMANGKTFKGSSPNKMVADKISAISNRVVLRRVKDVFDLGVLSQFRGYGTHQIYGLIKQEHKSLGDFDQFLNQHEGKSGLKHAYNLLAVDEGKPDFDELFVRVRTFVDPFIRGIDVHVPLYWVMDAQGRGMWAHG